jgi:hypothetical protein
LLGLPPDFTAGEIRMLELILTDETGEGPALPHAPDPTPEADDGADEPAAEGAAEQ